VVATLEVEEMVFFSFVFDSLELQAISKRRTKQQAIRKRIRICHGFEICKKNGGVGV